MTQNCSVLRQLSDADGLMSVPLCLAFFIADYLKGRGLLISWPCLLKKIPPFHVLQFMQQIWHCPSIFALQNLGARLEVVGILYQLWMILYLVSSTLQILRKTITILRAVGSIICTILFFKCYFILVSRHLFQYNPASIV